MSYRDDKEYDSDGFRIYDRYVKRKKDDRGYYIDSWGHKISKNEGFAYKPRPDTDFMPTEGETLTTYHRRIGRQLQIHEEYAFYVHVEVGTKGHPWPCHTMRNFNCIVCVGYQLARLQWLQIDGMLKTGIDLDDLVWTLRSDEDDRTYWQIVKKTV